MTYDDYDGLGLAAALRCREISSRELVDEAIARIERLNPVLNAVISTRFDEARAEAESALGHAPFAGVPFLVKDLMVFAPGQPLSNGSRAMRDFRPQQECAQARAIREAGFITLGRANCSELGASPLTNPAAFGPTHNPWKLNLNAGGSSGGSTAAVAARILPMASSSDGGGSIRLPASFCGVFGFKPSRGLAAHDTEQAWGGAVVNHVTTVSVRDSAAYLDWTSARRWTADIPAEDSFLAAVTARPRPLRIGVCTVSPAGGPVDPACVTAVAEAAALLESLGHRVEPCPLPYDGRAMLRTFLTVIMAYTRKDLEQMGEWLGQSWSALDVEVPTRFLGAMGGAVSAAALQAALDEWPKLGAIMARFYERYDLLLTPVTATLPLADDALAPKRAELMMMRLVMALGLERLIYSEKMLDRAMDNALAALPFTEIANVAGLPAMSVPLSWTEAGLPVGIQVMAARGQDRLLFTLAGELEQAAPWRDRRPPVC